MARLKRREINFAMGRRYEALQRSREVGTVSASNDASPSAERFLETILGRGPYQDRLEAAREMATLNSEEIRPVVQRLTSALAAEETSSVQTAIVKAIVTAGGQPAVVALTSLARNKKLPLAVSECIQRGLQSVIERPAAAISAQPAA